MASVAEGNGAVELCASLATDPAGSEVQNELVITLSTFDDLGKCTYGIFSHQLANVSSIITAFSGDDYVFLSMELTFPPGAMDGATACVDVDIIDDNIVEGMEAFGLLLSLSATELDVVVGDAMTVVTITDNEGK